MNAPRTGRPEAAAAIWHWRPVAPPPRYAGPVRLRGCLQASVGLAVAGLLLWADRRGPATVVAGVSAAIGLAALLSPFTLFAAIERSFGALGHWIGQALGWLLLPAIFYGFFAPFALLFRRGRRDAMKRHFEPEAPSYWSQRGPRSAKTGSASRERPY